MSNQELERARAELKAIGADFALLSSGDNVTYVSHFAVPTDFGANSTLSCAPPMAAISIKDNTAALVIPNSYEKDAKQQSSEIDVQSYAPVDWWTPTDGRANYLNLLRSALKQLGLGSSVVKLAIEERTLPVSALQLVQDEFPKVQFIEAGAALAAARKIKTERELDMLRF